MFKRVFLFLSILFFLGNVIFAEIQIPKYQGYVNDYANLFTPEEEKILEDKISDLEKKSSVEIGILTIESLNGQPLFTYSMAVARSWGIGKKDKDNGLLILIAKKERKIRIEVGYGLEGTITDAQAFWLIENILKPKFRQQKYFQGVNEVLDRISEAILNGEKIPEEKEQKVDWLFILFWIFFPLTFFLDILIIAVVKSLGKTKSWHLGGILSGGIALMIGFLLSTSWIIYLVAFIFLILGLVFDYYISKWYSKLDEKKRKEWEEEFRKKFHHNNGVGVGGIGSSSSGSFGGFGGGSFGGGGASSGW